MGISIVLIVVGFVLMTGTGTTEEHFGTTNFSTRRIKVAPWVCMAGYIGVGVSLFLRPKGKIIE